MISYNDPKHLAKEQTRKMQMAAQIAINAVLWQIIMQHAMEGAEEGDVDEVKDGILTIPKEELADIPKGFTLNVNQDNENVVITAGVKKNIIIPGN